MDFFTNAYEGINFVDFKFYLSLFSFLKFVIAGLFIYAFVLLIMKLLKKEVSTKKIVTPVLIAFLVFMAHNTGSNYILKQEKEQSFAVASQVKSNIESEKEEIQEKIDSVSTIQSRPQATAVIVLESLFEPIEDEPFEFFDDDAFMLEKYVLMTFFDKYLEVEEWFEDDENNTTNDSEQFFTSDDDDDDETDNETDDEIINSYEDDDYDFFSEEDDDDNDDEDDNEDQEEDEDEDEDDEE